MDTFAPTDDERKAIDQAQIRILYRHYPLLLLVNAVLALIVTAVLSRHLELAWLKIWLALMGLLLLVRLFSYVRFRRPGERDTRLWGHLFVCVSAFTGLLWGLASVYAYHYTSADMHLFMLFILMGLGAGAFASLTAHMPAFYAFICPTILPLAVTLLLQPEHLSIALGGIAIVYVMGLSFFGHNINAALVESLALRNQNLALVRELRQQKESAEMANRNKSRFLAAASHDLRQPLHALSLFVASLAAANRQPGLDSVIRNIADSANNLRTLFERLLDISRLDAGALRPAIQDFRLQDLLTRLDQDCRPAAQLGGLALDIPSSDACVLSDPLLLEQILRNLLGNALRYTDAGRVSLRCQPVAEGLMLSVADSGCGIPRKQQQQIFAEFVKLEVPGRPASAGAGLGLGLAIVERLAALLGHELGLESKPGRGSVFSITLPLGNPDRIRSLPGDGPPSEGRVRGMHVLVIDDDAAILEATTSLLGEWGCKVSCGASLTDVRGCLAARRRPDLIIADYRLGNGHTGLELVETLRSEWGQTLPALIISGNTTQETLERVTEAG